jgi:uncharacterized Zn-finger protein
MINFTVMLAKFNEYGLKKMDRTENEQLVTVKSKSVNCDGGSSGHPNIYLKIGEEKKAVCPYCSRVFMLKMNDPDAVDNELEN